MMFVNDKLYLSGILENHHLLGKVKPLIEVDIQKEKQILRGFGIEEVINNSYGRLYDASFDYNENEKKIIISHSISDSLDVTNLDQLQRFSAKSQYIKIINKLPKKVTKNSSYNQRQPIRMRFGIDFPHAGFNRQPPPFFTCS